MVRVRSLAAIRMNGWAVESHPRGGTRARARAPRARPQSRAAPWATGWFAPKRARKGTRGRFLPVSPLGGRPVACRGARPGLAGKPTAWGPIRGGGVSRVDVASKRDMKRVVLNRKNSLFVGNERGGETAAILSSLTATCKRHGVDPQLYLTQALTNVPQASGTDLERWLPDRWKVEQAHRVKQLGE